MSCSPLVAESQAGCPVVHLQWREGVHVHGGRRLPYGRQDAFVRTAVEVGVDAALHAHLAGGEGEGGVSVVNEVMARGAAGLSFGFPRARTPLRSEVGGTGSREGTSG